ncbi:hypothetical protein JXO59_07375 [candidate division KSB1 bacterium]|nr:hypothetical protein [candidate division KSB1 bacterium]
MTFNREHILYSLNVEDVFSVMDESGLEISLKDEDLPFLEDKIGEMIDWQSAIEYALQEFQAKHTRAKYSDQ